ncbi:MAG: cation:proton antiporter, partial [Gemmatimonadaceae bacterium]|nr:cation:proton antiporter [Gemmatimonadaceae bacterium]
MDHGFPHLLIVLVAILVATKVLGELAQRVGQPAVLGELIAGVLLGGSLLGVLDPSDPIIRALSEIGVIVLLFEIGLHTDLRELVSVGASAMTVAVVGVAVPFALGYGVAHLLGLGVVPAIVCGASLTATSIGISARVLSDLGQLETPEGRVVLGAAVLDDVIGLIILSVVSTLVAGEAVSLGGVGVSVAAATVFILAALWIGNRIALPAFDIISRVDRSGTLGVVALAFALLLAWLASFARSAPIVGAFAAGLVLYRAPQSAEIQRKVATLGQFFVPIFFASVGAAVDLTTLGDTRTALIGSALIAVALVGKFVAGYGPWWFKGNKALVGVAMIPRGEVG